MIKIEWDIVNGMHRVNKFKPSTKVVPREHIMDWLKDQLASYRGAEVTEKEYKQIERAFGVSDATLKARELDMDLDMEL